MDLLSKSDPFVVVYSQSKRDGPVSEVFRTKTIRDTLNPDFTDQFKMLYRFEMVQELTFEVYDRDSSSEDLEKHDFIGSCKTNLAKIMGSRGSTHESLLLDKKGKPGVGRFIVRGEEVGSNQDLLHLSLEAHGLDRKDWFGFGKSDPFYSIWRSREDNEWVKVHESEYLLKNLNPKWKLANLNVQKLCNGDPVRPLKIEVYDWNSNGSHVLIGEVHTSMQGLLSTKEFTLFHPKTKAKKGAKYKGSGTLVVRNCVIEKRHSFLDYIRGGEELNFMVAIDFTASNGAPSTPSSLHHMHAQSLAAGSSRNLSLLNEYQRAILAIGEVLSEYDHDQMLPVYGFGGAINGHTQHAFPLTFDPAHPQVHGVQGVMEAYASAFDSVSLSGPTLFGPILNKACELAAQSSQYTVLLILTDGIINDMSQTIDSIVAATGLPLSIIIVGVGSADFSNMEVLDADDVPLVSSQGKSMTRDIVQFVPFQEFRHAHYSAVAAATLAEVPEQFVSYMSMKGQKPKPPLQASNRILAIERSQRDLSGNQSLLPDDTNDGHDDDNDVPMAVPVPLGSVKEATINHF